MIIAGVCNIREADALDLEILASLETWPMKNHTKVWAFDYTDEDGLHTRFVTGETPPTVMECILVIEKEAV